MSGLERLQQIERSAPPRLSLAPGRERATPLDALAAQAFTGDDASLRAGLLADLAARFADDYPDNLFGDLDALAGRLGQGSTQDAVALAATIGHLSHHYGRHTELRFRYLHDFLYGLDWCRWAEKDAAGRAGIAPLSDAFLGYLCRRGDELSVLIAADDAKYGRLAPGQYRNPFGFDRSPASELLLLRNLRDAEQLPFDAWRLDGGFRVTPFVAARLALAKSMGLAADTGHL